MTGRPGIITTTFPVTNDLALTQSLFPAVPDLERFKCITAAYLDIESPIMLAGFASAEEIDPGPIKHFPAFLSMAAPATFSETLFTVDFFQACLVAEVDPFGLWGSWVFESVGVVDDLLTDSHGLLLWSHQLEGLLNSCGYNACQCQLLRQMINAKSAEAWESMEKAVLGQETTLVRLIDERMMFRFVLAPNYPGAECLWSLMNEDDWRKDREDLD